MMADTMESISVSIANHPTATVSAFAREFGFDRPNLAKCLNGGQDISVGLFMRVCKALGVLPETCVLPTHNSQLYAVSLRLYLTVSYQDVMGAVLDLVFDG